MFYGEGSDQPLFLLRKMILSKTADERKAALNELFPFVKADMKDTHGGHGRPAGHHPPARSAAARVRAAGRREAGRTGHGLGITPEESRSAARRCTSPTR